MYETKPSLYYRWKGFSELDIGYLASGFSSGRNGHTAAGGPGGKPEQNGRRIIEEAIAEQFGTALFMVDTTAKLLTWLTEHINRHFFSPEPALSSTISVAFFDSRTKHVLKALYDVYRINFPKDVVTDKQILALRKFIERLTAVFRNMAALVTGGTLIVELDNLHLGEKWTQATLNMPSLFKKTDFQWIVATSVPPSTIRIFPQTLAYKLSEVPTTLVHEFAHLKPLDISGWGEIYQADWGQVKTPEQALGQSESYALFAAACTGFPKIYHGL